MTDVQLNPVRILFIQGFGIEVPAEYVEDWKRGGVKQVIGQTELWPALLSKLTWHGRLKGRRVVFWIDNDSARYALIKQGSPSAASSKILWSIASVDVVLQPVQWFARVASKSNPADAPSRLCFPFLQKIGGLRVSPVLP